MGKSHKTSTTHNAIANTRNLHLVMLLSFVSLSSLVLSFPVFHVLS